jgi:hypothetical protein
MRTVPFSTILNEAVQLSGLDRDFIPDKTFRAFRDLCSNRLAEIWRREQWPFLIAYRNVTSGREAYQYETTAGSPLVTFTTLYQTFQYADLYDTGSQVLVTVDTTPAYKNSGAPLIQGSFPFTAYTSQTITLDVGVNQASTNVYFIGGGEEAGFLYTANDNSFPIRLPSDCETALAVLTEDPRASTRAVEVPFYLESLRTPLVGNQFSTLYDYAILKQSIDCWLQYRVACPLLTGDAYSSSTVYSSGMQSYYNGHFYISNYSGSGVAPSESGNTANWTRINIPELFRAFLVRAILSDYLRTESQFEQAAAAEMEAQTAYDRAVDFVLRQQQQTTKLNMVHTY